MTKLQIGIGLQCLITASLGFAIYHVAYWSGVEWAAEQFMKASIIN